MGHILSICIEEKKTVSVTLPYTSNKDKEIFLEHPVIYKNVNGINSPNTVKAVNECWRPSEAKVVKSLVGKHKSEAEKLCPGWRITPYEKRGCHEIFMSKNVNIITDVDGIIVGVTFG